MMDYYSQFPMPSLEERVKLLLDYVIKKNIPFDSTIDELTEIITVIAKGTKDLSYTGYSVFGAPEEKRRIDEYLESKKKLERK